MRDKATSLICWLLARLFDFFSIWRRALPSPKIGRYHKGQEVAADARLVRRAPTGVPGNIVIIKPCCLGDVVLSSAAVADLRAAFPTAFISYAAGDWSRPAVAHSPRIDTVVRWDFSPQRRRDAGGERGRYIGKIEQVWERVGGLWEAVETYRAAVRTLRNGRYDCAVILDRSPVLGLVAWLAGVPMRVGIDSRYRGFAHSIRVPLLTAPEHEADLYRRVAAELADSYSRAEAISPEQKLEFYPSDAARHAAMTVLARLNPEQRPVVIVHGGGGANPANTVLAKRWPAEHFAAIVARLFDNARPVVLVTGNAGDREDAARLLTEVARLRPDLRQAAVTDYDAKDDVLDCIEAFDIDTLGALCRQAALFVGNDTGLMHMATAQGAAVVAVFGPSDPRMYGPYQPMCGGWVAPSDNALWGRRLEDYQVLSAAAGGITAVTVDAVWAKVAECLPLRDRYANPA